MKEEHRRFHIRDIETKEIKESFTCEIAARSFLASMRWGNGNFYEVYDSEKDVIVYARIGKNCKKIEEVKKWE